MVVSYEAKKAPIVYLNDIVLSITFFDYYHFLINFCYFLLHIFSYNLTVSYFDQNFEIHLCTYIYTHLLNIIIIMSIL